MVAVPIMALKSISFCPSVRLSAARPSIHPSRPSALSLARLPIHPSSHIYLSINLSIYLSIDQSLYVYLSIYLQIWYRNILVPNALVPKRLGAESSRDFFLGWCRNVLVPKRLGPNRLGAETTWCRKVSKSSSQFQSKFLSYIRPTVVKPKWGDI